MGYEYDEDTAVEAVSEGRWAATVTDRWSIAGRPNGGYLLAIAGRAAAAALPHPDPVTTSAHFLRPPAPGPVELAVEVVRTGRTLSTAEVRMTQDGAEILRALTTFADLADNPGSVTQLGGPPELAPMDSLLDPPAELPDGSVAEIVRRFTYGVEPALVGWAFGQPTKAGIAQGWLAFADGRPFDSTSLLLVVDAYWPAAFDLGVRGWVPTVEMTAHVRARPEPGPLRVHVRSRFLVGRYVEEDAEVWDSADRLVAQGRQLAMLPPQR